MVYSDGVVEADKADDLTRIQIELPKERVKALDMLTMQAGVRTRKELLSNALTLFEWAVRETRRGKAIVSIDDREGGRMIELHMPILDALRPS